MVGAILCGRQIDLLQRSLWESFTEPNVFTEQIELESEYFIPTVVHMATKQIKKI